MTQTCEMTGGEYATSAAFQSLNIGLQHANSLGLDTFRACHLWLGIILTEASMADADAAKDLAMAMVDLARPGATDAQQAEANARGRDAGNRLSAAFARQKTSGNGWLQ